MTKGFRNGFSHLDRRLKIGRAWTYLVGALVIAGSLVSAYAGASDSYSIVDTADEAAQEIQESIKAAAQSSLRSAQNPRRCLSLDGLWDFKKAESQSYTKARVPGNWQSQFQELRNSVGGADYKKRIIIPVLWTGQPWLVFGAVDYTARVSVNDRYVGFHEGGYTPFAFNLASIVKPGEQADITLTVEDSSEQQPLKDYPFSEIPHGKQSWYGNISGPWQSIRLEERVPTHVKLLRVTPNVEASSATIEITLSQTPPAGAGQLLTTVYAPGSQMPVAQSRIDLSASKTYTIEVSIPHTQLWSPDSPKLYAVNTSVITEAGRYVDEYATRFGMRFIEARSGRLFLNGQPLFVTGALDQDFYPKTDYTVPSEDYLRNQFLNAKRLGFNLLRCHLKVPDPLYLSLADEIGLLVWYEVPNVNVLTPKSRARLIDTLQGMLNRDYNHPSLIMVSLIDEGWGVDVTNQVNRQWLVSAYNYAKQLDPTRLIVDNSACAPNFHVKTDIADFHSYFSVADHRVSWSNWLKEYCDRPAWLFSPYGDAVSSGSEPLLVSEFGNWGLPNLPILRECYGTEVPWWFQSREGDLSPDGVEQRFTTLGLGRVFGDMSRLARSTQAAQMRAFRWQVEELRMHPKISGYVWTQLTDTQWESNGVMDFCRNIKASGNSIALVQQPRCVFSRLAKHNVRSGQSVAFDLWGSNFGAPITGDTTLKWQLEGFPDVHGSVEVSEHLPSADARILGIAALTGPEVKTHRVARLQLKWMSDENVLAQNYEDISIFPPDGNNLVMRIFVDPNVVNKSGVTKWLEARQAKLTSGTLGADVAILSRLTPQALKWISEGGRAVLIANDTLSLGRSPGVLRIAPRDTSDRLGEWVSAFSWFAKSGAYSWLPMRGPTLDWGFDRIIPSLVIEGLTASEWPDADSGLFVAWLGSPSALVLRAKSGSGQLIITTYPLAAVIGDDLMAEDLLAAMITEVNSSRYLSSGSYDFSDLSAEHVLVPDALAGGAQWNYTRKAPKAGWQEREFDDS
ncbi:MAG: sugar-binding domain-containing protein, partial [Armatimonadota bacterium]